MKIVVNNAVHLVPLRDVEPNAIIRFPADNHIFYMVISLENKKTLLVDMNDGYAFDPTNKNTDDIPFYILDNGLDCNVEIVDAELVIGKKINKNRGRNSPIFIYFLPLDKCLILYYNWPGRRRRRRSEIPLYHTQRLLSRENLNKF